MRITALLLAMAALSLAQTSPESRVEFEVAAIRPARQDDNHDSDTNRGRYRAHNLTLKQLVAHAYDIDVKLISGGPKWVDSDIWDIDAKIPAESLQRTRDTVPRMLRSLLDDRFRLVIHREPQQISGFALVLGKTGPKMEQDRQNEGSKMHTRNAHLLAEGVTMEDLAKYLSRSRDVGKLVVDKTGLPGRFKFELEWKPERTGPTAPQEPASDDRAPIFTALQTSLGLKLQSAKIPISQIIIDRAEKPGEN
jgi:uncharacterized protein (TIGR03435 family)